MDLCHEFEEERPPEDAVVANVEACDFDRQHLPTFVVPRSTGYLQVNVSDGGGRLSWNNTVESLMHRG
jgi:hypothetical protein